MDFYRMREMKMIKYIKPQPGLTILKRNHTINSGPKNLNRGLNDGGLIVL